MLEFLESRRLLSVNITTFRSDIASTGANTNEIGLTPSNVKTGSFGKLFTTGVDGYVYAEPLVDSNVTVNGAQHNVVFIATENDSLYAIDTAGGAILWKRSFTSLSNSAGILNNPAGASAISPLASADVGTQDISPTIGITSTPVIDTARNLIYVVTKTKETIGGTTHFVQRLHAIKIADGTDTATPFTIGDTTGSNTNSTPIYAYGNGDGAVTDPYNGTGRQVVQFNALKNNQRSALSLVNNTVYVSWASHGDGGPYHGFIAAWNVSNITTSGFQLSGVLCTSPNDGEAGIWESGGGLVFESDGSAFYFMTGNGTGGAPTIGSNGLPVDANYNEAVVKAVVDTTTSPTNQGPNGWGLKVTSFFIPYNVAALDGADSDFGSGGPILLPDSAGISGHAHLLAAGGKDGRLYLLDRDNLGGFDPNKDNAVNAVSASNGHNTPTNVDSGTLSVPAYYNGKLYVISGYNGAAFSLSISPSGLLQTTSQTPEYDLGSLPGSPFVSANGATNGIVWLPDRATNELHAYDANTLSTELWNSSQASNNADAVGALVKFAVPTVANGQVFVGTTSSLVSYGATPASNAAPQPPVLSTTPISGSSVNLTWTDSSVAPNLASGYSIEESADGVNYTIVTTAPSGSTSIGIGGLSSQSTYKFRIRGFNGSGYSNYSNISTATTTSGTSGVSLSGGFSSAGSTLQLNGSATISGNNLQLTDTGLNEIGSVFTKTSVDITRFSTQFDFQIGAGTNTADGFTFTLQNVAPTALGTGAGGLGYASINKSAAIKFDLYNNSGEGSNSTGLFTSGATPSNGGVTDLSSTGINLHGGDPIRAKLTYDGTTLTVVLTDLNTSATATQSYTVNLQSTIGSGTAYAGFTGATGGVGALQNILNWTFSSGASVTPNTPSGLGATPASATSVNLTWTNSGAAPTGFYLDRATDAAFTQNLLTQTLNISGNSYTDSATGLAPGSTFYYRIRAFNAAGTTSNSNTASTAIPTVPPKPTNQQVTDVDTDEIDISFQDNAGHSASGYHIQRAVNHGAFVLVATLPPTSRAAPSEYDYSDTGLMPGTFYEYHIQAYNISGNNDFAGVNATTITLPPTNLSAARSGANINLSWTAASGATSYNVYRGTTSAGESGTPIATGITATTYTDTPPTTGSYFYTVTAVNLNSTYTPPLPAESASSNEATSSGSTTTTSSGLGGTIVGTSGSYDGVSTIAKVFDGDLSTFFDATAANGDYVGRDLGSAYTINRISFAPRATFASRMVGGVFQGSNSADFSGSTTLYTITSAPAAGLTSVAISNSTGFRYVRYLAPNGSYGNIAELNFYGTASGTTTNATQLTGTVIGTSGSYDGSSTVAKVFDGSLSTFFDGPTADGDYAGLDLGATYTVNKIAYAPRTGFESRMVGGVFQGSNTATFSSGVTTLATISAVPPGGFSTVPITSTTPFRYVRYLAPNGSYGNVAELQFYGTTASTADTQAPTVPGTPTLTAVTATTAQISWAASTDNVGVDHYNIYRAGTLVGTSTATSYTDTGLTASTKYSYTVCAADAAGNNSAMSGALSVTTSSGSTAGSALTGTIIGTSGSYDGTSTIAKVFDNNTATFFDSASPNNNYVGLDLGTASTISSIAFTPRTGFESRMTGGVFQGSNTSDFSTATTLFTITAAPASGTTTVASTSATAFRYVRYLAPAGSYGNVAELKFYGSTTTSTPTSAKLTGTVIGTTGSYDGTSTRDKAFDGSFSTFVDGVSANGNWTGLDLSTARTITSIKYAPRVGFESRMVGGIFQASNTADFSSGVVNLYTVTTSPADGFTTQSITTTGTFRYVRYLSPSGSFGNVSELEFDGY